MKGEVKNFSFLSWHHPTTETQSHRENEAIKPFLEGSWQKLAKKVSLCLCASVVKCIFPQP